MVEQTLDQVASHGDGTGTRITEASQLRLPPGMWPEQIWIKNRVNEHDPMIFRLQRINRQGVAITSVEYSATTTASFRIKLLVFND